jgi:hypothetical protein
MTLILVGFLAAVLTVALAVRPVKSDRWWLHPADMAPSEPTFLPPLMRSAPRAGGQAGLAVLALALALEAGAGIAPAVAAEPDFVFETPAAWSHELYEAPAVEPLQSWSLAAYSDGWFV